MSAEVIPAVPARAVTHPRSGVEVTATSWRSKPDLGMHGWLEQGRRLGVIGRGVGWWIGDWLRYGNERFGERYVRAARITGYDVQTLMNMVYVASRFEPEQRRESLSWSHHAELAALEVDERARWLELAAARRLSVRCLREELRRARRLEAHEHEEESANPNIQCPECGCRFARARTAPELSPPADVTEPTGPAEPVAA